MVKNARNTPRREDSLSRERLIDAAIELLDSHGKSGLTFRALAEQLATGPGAIYWHIDNKSDLLTAACDRIVARSLNNAVLGVAPEASIRAVALDVFDAIDSHPWVGSTLTRDPGQMPVVRILECVGQQVRALGVPHSEQWAVVSALLNYILGVGGQNAANGQLARTQGTDRSDFLEAVSSTWSQLDPDTYPFTRSVAAQLRVHDDRKDFLAGIDLILKGVASQSEPTKVHRKPAL